eukprot:TRINITY_DN5548_c0_g2_i1.p2 TRINITY_DN5548_c0_g2~~TRINITY_DN5548_c0_g2_i1.p2  ORF type:complete len:243 (+),score=96.22 TRINITY_DN5548_c0_g2_i1:55-783(+)
MAAIPAAVQLPQPRAAGSGLAPVLVATGAVLSKSDGVDKMAKTVMNMAKLVSASADRPSKPLDAFAKTLSDGRSVIRTGQWLRSAEPLQAAASALSAAPTEHLPSAVAKLGQKSYDAGYKFADNVALLSKHQMLDMDSKAWAAAAKRMQFGAFFADTAASAMALTGVGAKAVARDKVGRAVVTFVRQLLDTLNSLYGTNLMPGYESVPPWFPAACGLGSGGIAVGLMIEEQLKAEERRRAAA